MTAAPLAPAPPQLRVAGWALHAYTASGTAIAFGALVATVGSNEVVALWLLFAALVIDGTDGMLARRLRVAEVIPTFDGARLDDIVDYITYCFVPIFMLWNGSYLPAGVAGTALAILPLLASSYQFCRTDAKTDDNCFLGFPSYWNVVALYVIVLDASPATVAALLVVCSVLVFVPIRYLYPSKTRVHRRLNLGLAGAWLATYAVMLVQFDDPHPLVVGLSLAYVVYYLAASLLHTLRTARPAQPEGAGTTG